MLLLAPVADGVFLATYAERWLMSAAVAYLAQNLARAFGPGRSRGRLERRPEP
jgi:hypothetical protein